MTWSIKNYPISVPGLHEDVVAQNKIHVANSVQSLHQILVAHQLYDDQVSEQFETLDSIIDEDKIPFSNPTYKVEDNAILISG